MYINHNNVKYALTEGYVLATYISLNNNHKPQYVLNSDNHICDLVEIAGDLYLIDPDYGGIAGRKKLERMTD